MKHTSGSRIAGIVVLAVFCSGCAFQYKKDEAAAKNAPVNCATADGDIRVLQSEKAHVASQIAMGVTAIYPASLVVGLLTGTEGTKIQVATGEYNKALDAKIAEIKSTCGL